MRYGVRCINTMINKINELLTEGGRHVTICKCQYKNVQF